MTVIVPPQANRPIIDASGTMTQEMRAFAENIALLSILTGSGSPEGVQVAQVGRLYMDTAGTAGNILYIKRDNDIAGDTSQGWILV